jgi:hypothetical protein
MPRGSRKSPDVNEIASAIMAHATGGAEHPMERPEPKKPAADALGRLGGLKGKARAKKLTPRKRKARAKKAAAARWKRRPTT